MNYIFILVIVFLSLSVPITFATSDAKLHLDVVGGAREGQSVIFSGQLSAPDGTAIQHRTIFILDDTSYFRPDIILAITTTNSNGMFSTSWNAIQKDNGKPFNFYAKFIGGKTFGYTTSETYESVIKSSDNSTNSDVVPSKTMPIWFKSASEMWHNGEIRDMDYSYGINNLVDYGIVKSNATINSEQKLPEWLKNVAGWFANGEISNDEYSNTLGYLLDSNIIKL